MARHEDQAVLIPILAMLGTVVVSACSSALAQTDQELAAGFTERNPIRPINLDLPDGGYICRQINVTGNECHDPRGFPTACCLTNVPPSTEPSGPFCLEWAPTLIAVQQVGKGFCCIQNYPGTGSYNWYRYDDETKACDFCGGKTPGPNECCTRDRDVVPKEPIQNLDDCPDRVKIKDPTVNGCGQQGDLRNIVIPQRFGPVPFAPSCNVHDVCYGTCRSDKASCDTQLRDLLRSACMNTFAAEIEAIGRAGGDARALSLLLNRCLDMADNYFGAVVSMGQDAYDKAQKGNCKCCE
jgi:secretory phospholipase A2